MIKKNLYVVALAFVGGAIMMGYSSPVFASSSISVIDYGAIANDSKDDTSAFIKAIDAAKKDAAIVHVPVGAYHISKPLTIPAGVTLQGEGQGDDPLQTPKNGSTLYYDASGYMITILGHQGSVRNLSLVDKSNGKAQGGIRILADGKLVESVIIQQVLISNFFKGTALQLTAINGGGIAYATIDNVRARQANIGYHIIQDAKSFVNSNSFFHGAISGGEGNAGILIEGGNNNTFYSTVIEPYQTKQGHLVIQKGQIDAYGIRIEGQKQPKNIPLVQLHPSTYNNTIQGTFAGGLVRDLGSNDVQFLNGKYTSYQAPSTNKFANSSFSSIDGKTIPGWDIIGKSVQMQIQAPQIVAGQKVLKIQIPAGESVEIKPSLAYRPLLFGVGLYDQVNFGFYVQADRTDIAVAKVNAMAGVTISHANQSTNKREWIGMNARINNSVALDAALLLQNTSKQTAIVYVSSPALTFGVARPALEAKPITDEGAQFFGSVSLFMKTISSLPTDGYVTLPGGANLYEVSGKGTILRINHTTKDHIVRGTVVTLVFDTANIVVKNSAYIKLLKDYTTVVNGSLTLVSLGDGTWRELQRNQ